MLKNLDRPKTCLNTKYLVNTPNIHSDPLVNMLKNFTGLKKFWKHPTYSDMGGTYICCDLFQKKVFNRE